MDRNVAVLFPMCFLLCLTFNCSLPLQRGSNKWSVIESYYGNNSQICDNSMYPEGVKDRSEKMMSYMDNVVKKIKDTTQDTVKNVYDGVIVGKRSDDKNTLSKEDLRQYEQLVIMKKYPYLDMKELELKYSPGSNKNARHSVNFESDSNIDGDPSLSESFEEGPNVEITNRGLSGFSIPRKLPKNIDTAEHDTSHMNFKNSQTGEDKF